MPGTDELFNVGPDVKEPLKHMQRKNLRPDRTFGRKSVGAGEIHNTLRVL